ncbi:hypothetical protein SAMN06265360_10446 [Haloechinothrix alba]|uniref:Uncharacterized protein n=1 Tax=Haloechinothrix alba TaxID=664784 RepID=A0A238VTT3_9PSEU|nr:hypothetical protein SAMN06265360_10446 [Haloechinothrix alba]
MCAALTRGAITDSRRDGRGRCTTAGGAVSSQDWGLPLLGVAGPFKTRAGDPASGVGGYRSMTPREAARCLSCL